MSDPVKEVEVHDKQGRLTGRFQLAGGELHGLATLFSAGRMLAEVRYLNGMRDGEMRSYGEFGQLASIVPHAADVPHGEARFFHPDGSLARSAGYKEGRLHGEVRDYAPDGKLVSVTNYVDGKPEEASGQAIAPAPSPALQARKTWLTRLVEG